MLEWQASRTSFQYFKNESIPVYFFTNVPANEHVLFQLKPRSAHSCCTVCAFLTALRRGWGEAAEGLGTLSWALGHPSSGYQAAERHLLLSLRVNPALTQNASRGKSCFCLGRWFSSTSSMNTPNYLLPQNLQPDNQPRKAAGCQGAGSLCWDQLCACELQDSWHLLTQPVYLP